MFNFTIQAWKHMHSRGVAWQLHLVAGVLLERGSSSSCPSSHPWYSPPLQRKLEYSSTRTSGTGANRLRGSTPRTTPRSGSSASTETSTRSQNSRETPSCRRCKTLPQVLCVPAPASGSERSETASRWS